MKPFDKAAAMRGARVCTREGRKARILCFDLYPNEYIAVAILRQDFESVEICRNNGENIYVDQSMDNLMMADDDYMEKLERGWYNHIGDPTEKVGHILPYRDVTPAVELITPFDEFYWRRMYAGMAMQGLCAANGAIKPASMIAEVAVEYADALIEEIKKKKE